MARTQNPEIDLNGHERLAVYGVQNFEHKGEDKSRWTLIGTAFQNKDGSLNVKLDYAPTNGATVQIRPFKPREEGAPAE